MAVNATNGAITSANDYVLYGRPNNSAATAGDILAPPSTAPSPEVKQITLPSTVTLDPDHAQSLLSTYKTYDAITQASLSALAQTLRIHDDLVKQLSN